MTQNTSNLISRRGLLGVFAATAVVAAPTYSNAFGVLKGAGDIRRIRMYSGRTGESIDTIYWIEGKYIPEVLAEINHFMRDWRTGDTKQMDPRNVDIMAAAHRLMDVSESYMLLSGYRSPKTNAMLRSQSGGVAKNWKSLARLHRLPSISMPATRVASKSKLKPCTLPPVHLPPASSIQSFTSA